MQLNELLRYYLDLDFNDKNHKLIHLFLSVFYI